MSEAESMRRYLTESRHVPADAVLMEDRSTTTMENLRFSKEIMDARSGVQSVPGRRGLAYRCALVASDYHVFRASEYAHHIGLKADGGGSHTRGYYWPTAFIREFIAVTKAHLCRTVRSPGRALTGCRVRPVFIGRLAATRPWSSSPVLYSLVPDDGTNGPVAQLVRAPPCHGGGHRFKSGRGRFFFLLSFFSALRLIPSSITGHGTGVSSNQTRGGTRSDGDDGTG